MDNTFHSKRGERSVTHRKDMNLSQLDPLEPSFILNRKGEIVAVNNAFCQLVGWAREDLIGMRFQDSSLLTPESRKKANLRHVSKLIGKEQPTYSIDVQTSKGRTLPLHIDATPKIKHGKIVGEINTIKATKRPIRDHIDTVGPSRSMDASKLNTIYDAIQEKNRDMQTIQSALENTTIDIHRYKQKVQELTDKLQESQLEVEGKRQEIVTLKQIMRDEQSRMEQKKQELFDLTEKLRKNNIELEEKNHDITRLSQDLELEKGKTSDHQEELSARNAIIAQLKNQLTEQQMSTKKRIGEFQTVQMELEQKDHELQARNTIISQLQKQLFENQPALLQKAQLIAELQEQVEQERKDREPLEKEMQNIRSQLLQKESALQQKIHEVSDLQETLSKHESTLDDLKKELSTRNTIIKETTKQLAGTELKLKEKIKTIEHLHEEKTRVDEYITQINNALPVPVLLVDNQHNITNWNTKLEELSGINPINIKNSNIFSVDWLHDDRLHHAQQQSVMEKKPVTIESISLQGSSTSKHLANITHVPLFDSNGEWDGSIFTIDDVTDRIALESALQKKNEDVEIATKRFRDAQKKLHLIDAETKAANQDLKESRNALRQKTQEITQLQNELAQRQQEFTKQQEALQEIQRRLDEKNTEIMTVQLELRQLQKTTDIREEELNRKQEELGRLHDEINDRQKELEGWGQELQQKEQQMTTEIQQMKGELESKHEQLQHHQQQLEQQTKELSQMTVELNIKQEDVTKKTSEIHHLQQELQTKEQAIQTHQEEIERLQSELEEKHHTVSDMQQLYDEKNAELRTLQSELDAAHHDIKARTLQVEEQHHTIAEQQKEIEARTSALEWFKVELEKKSGEIDHIKDEFAKTQATLDEKVNQISHLSHEKEQMNLQIKQLQHALPAPVIAIDANDVVTNWNKHAEKMFGISAEQALGKKLFEIHTLLGKDRVREGQIQCQRDKSPISVNSVSLTNKQGETILTNISQMPILDGKNQPRGAIMVIHDVSNVAEMQMLLKQKQDELEQLNERFHEIHTQLQVVNKEKQAHALDTTKMNTDFGNKTKEMAHLDTLFQDRQKQLQTMQDSIEIKTRELGLLTTQLQEQQASLASLQQEQKELAMKQKTDAMQTSPAVRHKLTLTDEIDKCLDLAEGGLQTKKFTEETSDDK